MYYTFFVLSIAQLIFVAVASRYWVAMLHWLTFARTNPLNREGESSTWMFEVLVMTSFHLMVLFFAATSGLGVYIGSTWLKARHNRAALEEEVGFYYT